MEGQKMICAECGCTIYTTKGALYNPNIQRFICSNCYKNLKKQSYNYVSPSAPRNPWWRWVSRSWRAIVAFLCIFIAFFAEYEETGERLDPYTFTFVFIIGLSFLIWHVIYTSRNQRNAVLQYQTKLYNDRLAAGIARNAERGQVRICPFCGAHTYGDICEYCDSPYNIGE